MTTLKQHHNYTTKGALEELQLAFDYRKDTPSASGTWISLVNGLAPENWELFKDYLKDGKQARMYVCDRYDAARSHQWPPA